MAGKRVDDNHGEIVAALRRVGAEVQSLASMGGGVPDLLVLYRGVIILMEVKDGDKPPSKRRLTPMEAKFHARWENGPLFVVTSVDEALTAIGAI